MGPILLSPLSRGHATEAQRGQVIFPRPHSQKVSVYWPQCSSRTAPFLSFAHMAHCACSIVSNSLRPHGLYPLPRPAPRSPWDFPGKNTGAGCHFLLQRIRLTQGWNLHLLCLLYWLVSFVAFCFFNQLSHQGQPSFSPAVSWCVYAPSPSSPPRSLL